jgi:hypothetical protein
MNSQEIKDVVTVLVLLGGAAGAAWKWLFSEILRRRSEIPALDGHFLARCIAMEGPTIAVELCATWRNKGTVPVFANCNATLVEVFQITSGDSVPGGDKWWDSDPVRLHKPFEDRAFFYMEPGTDTEIQTVLLLPSDGVFVARFQLVIPVPSNGRSKFARALRRFTSKRTAIEDVIWVRTHLFSTRVSI